MNLKKIKDNYKTPIDELNDLQAKYEQVKLEYEEELEDAKQSGNSEDIEMVEIAYEGTLERLEQKIAKLQKVIGFAKEFDY